MRTALRKARLPLAGHLKHVEEEQEPKGFLYLKIGGKRKLEGKSQGGCMKLMETQ